MSEFWYDLIKPKYGKKCKIMLYGYTHFCSLHQNIKYGKKGKLCYMDIDSIVVYIKIEGVCIDIAKDVQTRFDTSNYKLE